MKLEPKVVERYNFPSASFGGVCERNLVALISIFGVPLKAIFCVQHFCSFDTMLFIVNLFIKTDSIVICVPCMLGHI